MVKPKSKNALGLYLIKEPIEPLEKGGVTCVVLR
jgi:hypothetical protein